MYNRTTYPAKMFSKFLPHDYRRHKVDVVLTDSVTLHDLNWSGGTLSTYNIFDRNGRHYTSTEHYSAKAPWDNPAEGAKLPIPDDAIVVRTGFFCGKISLATIYVKDAGLLGLGHLPQIAQELNT